MSFTRETFYPPNPPTERARSVKLSVDPTGRQLVYGNGRSVIIRDLQNPSHSWSYSQHTKEVTVARLSPSGSYCASGDLSGTVRVWDVLGTDLILKSEKRAVAGRVNDLAWDSESKRLIGVGEGRESFGSAWTYDTASSTGEITGHTKALNAVAIKATRPFRAVVGGDDMTTSFYEGVPWKYRRTNREHAGIVQSLGWQPGEGRVFVAGGSGRKVLVFEGKEGDLIGEAGKEDDRHKGGVFGVAWEREGRQFASSSADGTVKIWDAEASQLVDTWTIGSGVDHQQLGNVWATTDEIVSVSLSGALNIIDRRKPGSPARILHGHQKPISAFTKTADGTFFTSSFDGRVHRFDAQTGEASAPITSGASAISKLAASGRRVYSVGLDDTLKEIDADSEQFTATSAATGGPAKGLTADANGTILLATEGEVRVFREGKNVAKLPVKFEASAVALSPTGPVAVGSKDNKVYTFQLNGTSLEAKSTLDRNRSPVTALSFSPDGNLLASGDSSGKIILFDATSGEIKSTSWGFHTARIEAIAWSPDGTHAASASLDTNVYVWSLKKPTSNIAIKSVHPNGATGVQWVSDEKLASTGADAGIRIWQIKRVAGA